MIKSTELCQHELDQVIEVVAHKNRQFNQDKDIVAV